MFVPAGVQLARLTDFPYPANLPEGRFANYYVTLATIPQSPVNISLSPSSALIVTPLFFSFTPATWNVSQEIHVVAIQDNVVRSSPFPAYLNWAFASADGNYSSFAQQSVILVEDDSVGLLALHYVEITAVLILALP